MNTELEQSSFVDLNGNQGNTSFSIGANGSFIAREPNLMLQPQIPNIDQSFSSSLHLDAQMYPQQTYYPTVRVPINMGGGRGQIASLPPMSYRNAHNKLNKVNTKTHSANDKKTQPKDEDLANDDTFLFCWCCLTATDNSSWCSRCCCFCHNSFGKGTCTCSPDKCGDFITACPGKCWYGFTHGCDCSICARFNACYSCLANVFSCENCDGNCFCERFANVTQCCEDCVCAPVKAIWQCIKPILECLQCD